MQINAKKLLQFLEDESDRVESLNSYQKQRLFSSTKDTDKEYYQKMVHQYDGQSNYVFNLKMKVKAFVEFNDDFVGYACE